VDIEAKWIDYLWELNLESVWCTRRGRIQRITVLYHKIVGIITATKEIVYRWIFECMYTCSNNKKKNKILF
jgi:hypothetical protein